MSCVSCGFISFSSQSLLDSLFRVCTCVGVLCVFCCIVSVVLFSLFVGRSMGRIDGAGQVLEVACLG